MDESTEANGNENGGKTGRSQGRIKDVIGTADSEIRDKLSNAVTVAGERSDDLRAQLETLSQKTAEAASPVLESVRDHIENNDIDVTIAENRIHIEGDDAGLNKIEADLKRAIQGTDVHLEYDRESGINLEIDDGDSEPKGTA